jgi:hypothetical protein
MNALNNTLAYNELLYHIYFFTIINSVLLCLSVFLTLWNCIKQYSSYIYTDIQGNTFSINKK